MPEQTTQLAFMEEMASDLADGAFSWSYDSETWSFSKIVIAPVPPASIVVGDGEWPMAFLHGDRGRILQDTASWEDREFTLTVYDMHGTDNLADYLMRKMLALSDALYDTFHHDQGNAVWTAADLDESTIYLDEDNTPLMSKSWLFRYRLRRA